METDRKHCYGFGFDDIDVANNTGRHNVTRSSLGTLYDSSADYQMSKRTSPTFYLGYICSGDVIGKIYSGRDAVFSYVEVTQRFQCLFCYYIIQAKRGAIRRHGQGKVGVGVKRL